MQLKQIFRGKFIVVYVIIEKKNVFNSLSFHLKLCKEEQTKSKASRKKETNIKAGVGEIKNQIQ